MLRHLRLARARGSLTAPNHPVQDRALEVLGMLDEIGREKSRMDTVRLAMTQATADYDRAKAMFPEYFAPADPFEDAVGEDGEFDPDAVDEAALDWGTPDSPQTDEEIARWIAEREQGSISVADMEDRIY